MPSATARALGLSSPIEPVDGQLPRVRLEVRGRAATVPVAASLGPETIGALSGAMAAIGALWFVQRLTGLSGRVTRILVTTKPGQRALVQRELTALAAGRLTVASADQDVALLKQAVTPNTEATGFFVLVSGDRGPAAGVQRDAVDRAGAPAHDGRSAHAGRAPVAAGADLAVPGGVPGRSRLAAGARGRRLPLAHDLPCHAQLSVLSIRARHADGHRSAPADRVLRRRRARDLPGGCAAAARPAAQPRGRRRVLRGRRTRAGARRPRATAPAARRAQC